MKIIGLEKSTGKIKPNQVLHQLSGNGDKRNFYLGETLLENSDTTNGLRVFKYQMYPYPQSDYSAVFHVTAPDGCEGLAVFMYDGEHLDSINELER